MFLLELGVDYLDKNSHMDYCAVQANDSSDSDVEIDIVNLRMSLKSSSAFVSSESSISNGTAARLIPFSSARFILPM